MKFRLIVEPDVIMWKFGNNNKFSVKSIYNALTVNDAGPTYRNIWKGKIPNKIKVFLWLIEIKWKISHLLFNCKMAKVVWSVTAKCFGADNVPKNVHQAWRWCDLWIPGGQKFHESGIAALCWAILKTRNKACFEGKIVKHLVEIICYACTLMRYSAGLFAEMDK